MPATLHALQLGDIAPDFSAETTDGRIQFHQWIGNSWCVLFSHPRDFTPVCTTEIGYAAKIKKSFDARNVKIIALSVDGIKEHHQWLEDIRESQQAIVNFPLIADNERTIAELYGMMHPHASETATVRTVFIIDQNKKIRLTMSYPASTGRNFEEILRVIDSMQMTDNYKVATPANWKKGDDCVILPSIKDPNELKKLFPEGYREVTSYLRMTRDPSSPK